MSEPAPAPFAPRHSSELVPRVGTSLGVSGWRRISQEDVDAFARLTGDDYWLHTDPGRAAETRFGGTIAHGFLTLSLAPALTYELIDYEGFESSVNYGLNRVRFPAPLPVGSEVRMRAEVAEVEIFEGGAQLSLSCVFQRRGADKPVCVAETLTRVFDRTDGGDE
jgi:acyl dehydratase